MGFFTRKIGTVFFKDSIESEQFIEKLQKLSERASDELKIEIEKQIKIAKYGLQGENAIAYELKNSGMDMYVLRDIYLEVGDLSAQIDYIFITRKHIYVIECKNLIGNIEIDNGGNFIRSYELSGKKVREGIYSPITQNQRHLNVIKQLRLQSKTNFFAKAMFEKSFEDNYKSLIVLANPKTCLDVKYAKKEVKSAIIRIDQLVSKIKEMDAASKEGTMSEETMRELAEVFSNASVSNHSDYAKKYEELLLEVKSNGENLSQLKPFEGEGTKKDNRKVEVNVFDEEQCTKELKKFRLDFSRAEGVKPYYIFTDVQMKDLVEKRPETKEQLLQISGFGNAKVEKYGKHILRILNSF